MLPAREVKLVTLLVWSAIFILFLLATAWLVAWAARAAGSQRGWFSVGLLVALLVLVVNLVCLIIQRASPAKGVGSLALAAALLAAQLVAAFAMMRAAFALPSRRTWVPWSAWLATGVVQAMLALLIVRPFVGEAFVIPTRTMSPTLEPGDRFMVNKLLRPRRLDLVAYHSTSEPGRPIYCKRLIALPGERLRFEHGGIFVDDHPVTLPPVLAGRCHARLAAGAAGWWRYYDGENIMLGPDEFFFVGDNIEISADSRLAGPSRAADLVGVVDLVYWPPKKARVIR